MAAGVKAVRGRDVEYLCVWVDVAAEADSAEPQPRVHAREAESDPPRLSGDGDRHAVTRSSAGRRRQPVGIGVAADDAVHDHDVCSRGLVWVLGVIGDVTVDSILQLVLCDQSTGDGFVAIDYLDVCSVTRAGFEQLDLEAADATARPPAPSVRPPLFVERLEDPEGGAGETVSAITARVALDRLRCRRWCGSRLACSSSR